jgi:hypothetical protein
MRSVPEHHAEDDDDDELSSLSSEIAPTRGVQATPKQKHSPKTTHRPPPSTRHHR